MAQHFVLVCQIMQTAIDTVPIARLCLKDMAQHFVLVCQTMTTAYYTVPRAQLCH
ncbi:MAG: hypothetical protein IJ242_11800 [Clostridia bacterium]|nr:hypothetical protein [Clostridia bacterium]